MRTTTTTTTRPAVTTALWWCSTVLVLSAWIMMSVIRPIESKLADRARLVQHRQATGQIAGFHDNGHPLEGQSYRVQARANMNLAQVEEEREKRLQKDRELMRKQQEEEEQQQQRRVQPKQNTPLPYTTTTLGDEQTNFIKDVVPQGDRHLSSQLSGCCYNYEQYSATTLCALYGQDCESGETPSHDSGDDDCSIQGLSFIGISFSVNTASGNPYSYQLNDQFPMENIIDRDYEYVMSMDEDGWLVGGGYKTFDYSGKMPYIDSSHTELLRIGNMNPDTGGTSIEQVYAAMSGLSFAPFSIYPEYLKGGGGHHSGDNDSSGVPASDVTLVVSIAETYEDDDSYSAYETFLDNLFDAMDAVGGGPCMDDHDTDPHVSMARGVKFWSSYHQQQYMYAANLEVAVWQSMYPNGVAIGSAGYAAFPPGRGGQKQAVGYGNLYFFFDRANITKAFAPYRGLTDTETTYATLYASTDVSSYYASTTTISFDYSGSGDQNGGNDWEWNPYSWNQRSAKHDMTDGWELPPNCLQEGETFFGIPLSRSSGSKLQSSMTFQEQFDFEMIVDRNGTYITSFGTNHGWLIGEQLDNAVGSIVDKDTAHIPLFYTGTTNPNMGGISLGDLIKVAKKLDFGTLYIKPAFVFVDDDGHVKLQFEADMTSALAYLYDNLCKMIGITWNGDSPSNAVGTYSNCAMHAAGDRAKYGCGPDGTGTGGFCPQMTLAYSPRFSSEEDAAAYLDRCNSYVDYWRSLYPSGVAVGTSKFCANTGGCLGLFLNRLDLYEVFKPDLGGAWVEYNGASMPPTYSPAPTWQGGCDDPHNFFLDKCVRKRYKPKPSAVAWDALGSVGQMSVMLVIFMAITLSVSIFLARARKKRRRGESYLSFFFRDLTRKRKKKRRKAGKGLDEKMLPDGASRRSRSTGRRSSKNPTTRRAKSSTRHSSREGGGGRSSVRHHSVQPGGNRSRSRRDRMSGTDSVGTGGSIRDGVVDLTKVSLQPDEGKDNRQQLV